MSFKQSLSRVRALTDLPALALELGFEATWHRFEAHQLGELALVGRRSGFLAFGVAANDPPRAARRVARWVTGRGVSAVVLALAPERRFLAFSVSGIELPVASIALDRIRALDERILERAKSVRHDSPLAAAAAWAEALAGQSLGDRFFDEFRGLLDRAVEALPRAIPARDRHGLGLLALTRILFLYFVQERGWLDGRPRFLREELDRCLGGRGGVEDRLLAPLFFGTLNRPAAARGRAALRFGRIPFLNGGLFDRHPLERRWAPRLPDDFWRDAFDQLFERYHFTIQEDDPCRSSIGPDMLGRVFERVMDPDARHRSGAFYTPSELVDRVVDQALRQWLAERLGNPRVWLYPMASCSDQIVSPTSGEAGDFGLVLVTVAPLPRRTTSITSTVSTGGLVEACPSEPSASAFSDASDRVTVASPIDTSNPNPRRSD
ncbi:MAG: hypothetical protein FJ206_00200 [Gemmatimonadetes bacterium]|nr:hypothetical protein [Gemmatimonadota bacterium]